VQEIQDLDKENLPIDWNPDENWSTRLWKRIIEEKIAREQQRQELEKQRQELEEEKQQIAQQKYDLDVRENRLVELEPLIPSVKQLQGYGISFELILPYMETLNEKAVAENIDSRLSYCARPS
jgi:hypothetical protein